MAASGYSGTPLARKLGIKEGSCVCAVASPVPYMVLIAPGPATMNLARAISGKVDIVHVFTTTRAVLTAQLETFIAKARPDAAMWVSWPKKSSQVPSEITEDTIRELALPLGLVDVKVCAVNETWSGLKLVWRVELRGDAGLRQRGTSRPRS